MTSYLVPGGYGEAEYVEKRSRFIARVWRVGSQTEAEEKIRETCAMHSDATHNVYAYILKDGGVMRYSDDGEPGGTSGMPTLNVFRSGGVFDVCCVVTRYFGGILLGSGGLVRAYSNAAKLALDSAGTAVMGQWKQVSITCPYSAYERMCRLLDARGAAVENPVFEADVTLSVHIRADMYDGLEAAISDLTSGAAGFSLLGESFRAV